LERLQTMTIYLVTACDKCPIKTTIMIFLFMIIFNLAEAHIESLLFGKPFKHWLDIVFTGAFMGYTAYSVYICAILRREDSSGC
jgi:hypothetical protein